jgi:hypothetical protein
MAALSLVLILQLASQPACTVPGMVPEFWPAVVRAESHYDPLALHDDTADRPYYPATAEQSETIATQLMAQGHSVGVGLSQLTARSPQELYNKFGITIRDALDSCKNMQTGARFFVSGALSIYNTGDPTKGMRYAQQVMGGVGVNAAKPEPIKVINKHASDTEVWE